MDKDNNENISKLDIEYKDWLKLKRNMKTFGFQEGIAKGKESTLQEGFNEGFSIGFKMGMQLGMARNMLSCTLESGLQIDINFDEELSKFLNEFCILCQHENNKEALEDKLYGKSLKNIISEQEKYNDYILKNLKIPNYNLKTEKKI